MEHLKMPQEFYTLLNFNFIIYIIYILELLKNQLNYLRNSIFKCFFKENNMLLFFLNNFFSRYIRMANKVIGVSRNLFDHEQEQENFIDQ